MIAHCMFEQSGTFKNEFKKLGIEAYDYDIQNEFGETDFKVDLFDEIKKAYEGWESIFDRVGGRTSSWHFSLARGLRHRYRSVSEVNHISKRNGRICKNYSTA